MANTQRPIAWEQYPVGYDSLNLTEDYYCSVVAADPFELFDIELPSIHSDVLKISSDIGGSDDCGGAAACGSGATDSFSVTGFDDFDLKPEIRNGDCMWWSGNTYSSQQNANGSGSEESNSAASSYSESMSNAVPLAAVTGSTPAAVGLTSTSATMTIESATAAAQSSTVAATTTTEMQMMTMTQQRPTLVVANNSKFTLQRQQQQNYPTMLNLKAEIKLDLQKDYELQLQQHNIPNNRTMMGIESNSTSSNGRCSSTAFANSPQQSMQHIPPGTSLLRKSNNNHATQKKYQQKYQMQLLQKEQQKNMMHLENSSCMLTPNTPSTTASSLSSSPSWSTSASGVDAVVDSSANYNSIFLRPDTPHSLDEDAIGISDAGAEFRHNVDLRACVMGSNNMALPSASLLIDRLSRELQNTSKVQFDNLFGNTMTTLNDVMDIIGNQPTSSMSSASSIISNASTSSCSASSSSAFSSGLSCSNLSLSGNGLDGNANGVDSGCGGSVVLNSDCESSDDGECSFEGSNCEFATSLLLGDVDGSSGHYLRHISDHSYTRRKDMGMDDLSPNLETPSDSDEEIDVVSVGDRKLPTNPSDKDRRVLQSKVAHKFSNARIVKTAYGVRTIPPRRRGSYELPYTPASTSPVKSVANSRYPSPASTPYQQYAVSPASASQCAGDMLMLSNGATSTPLSATGANMLNKSRKRFVLTSSNGCRGDSSSGLIGMPPTKKYRVKKSKHGSNVGGVGINGSAVALVVNTAGATVAQISQSNGSVSSSSSNNMLKRQFSLDEADTIEKRNLHNDMERQRRIGLKNLFEALKKQIPSIKDKERAPKVNILREAAKLCEQLTRDDRELSEQKARLMEQLKTRKEHLARMQASLPREALTVTSNLD